MDYVGSVTYVTQDKDWLKKIGLGVLMALLSIVLVGSWALTGWAMEAFRRVVRNDEEKLPGWDDLGAYIGQGLKFFVVTLVWSLPMIIIVAILAGIGAAAAANANLESGEAAMMGITLLAWLLAIVYSLAISFLSIGAFVILAQTGDLGQAINPLNAWNLLKRNLGKWALSALVLIAGSAILSAIGSLLCGVGALVATPWTFAMSGNLLGQTFAETGAEL